MENFTNINGFQLENPDKLERVVLGTMVRAGTLEGGLGLEAKPETVLANYDKIGGYITKDGIKIKTGSFWDFKLKKPKEEPEVLYIFDVGGGDKVEVSDPTKLGAALSTIKEVQAKKEEVFKEKKAKSKFNKK